MPSSLNTRSIPSVSASTSITASHASAGSVSSR
uniref:Uncharacterized protein n=1 Tax=Siphoviridae sp. ctnLs3 TaxID=2827937 RepID=A0A8S5TD32_9CAUD|nr:MAG TPA: hypothetical protein [Siphoviridae sp. ctnLs3]